MNKLLIVLLLSTSNVLAGVATEEPTEYKDKHYNTCRTSNAAIKSAKQQEAHYRNQLLFTREKGTNSQRVMYESQITQITATREMFEKMYETLQCSTYFDEK